MTDAPKLRPCPGCSNKPAFFPREIMRGPTYRCVDTHCSFVKIEALEKEWNSAYCWREIDRLKAENERMAKERTAYREAFIFWTGQREDATEYPRELKEKFADAEATRIMGKKEI